MSKQGETNLQELIQSMNPILNEGEFVFSTLKEWNHIPRELTVCEFKEKEGLTVILKKEDADRLNLDYHYVASWITLNIHSSLEAYGLTAAFSTELANHQISCNVIAGYYHDHIFVNKKDGKRALKILKGMSNQINS